MSPAEGRVSRRTLPMWLRLLLGLALILAVAATGLLVFAQELRWQRLAVVLALWAALIGSIALTRARRDTRQAEIRLDESKRIYELELHREVMARREYESRVTETARDSADVAHREELDGLREQLDRLNSTLSALLDGDLLFERMSISAESTRVRQVGDGGRSRLTAMAGRGVIEGGYPSRLGDQPDPGATGWPAQARTSVPQQPREGDAIQIPVTLNDDPGQDPADATDGGRGVVLEPIALEEVGAEPVVSDEDVEPVASSEPESAALVEPVAKSGSDSAVVEPVAADEVVEPEPESAVAPEPTSADSDLFSEQAATPSEGDEEASDAGHSAGISVADLIAAFGNQESVPHRRRRAAD